MIESLQAVILALAAAINSAQVEVRIETQALKSPAIIMALESARKRGVAVEVVLGAKAEYTLDVHGQPTGGNRPYDGGPQGPELRALDAMQASVFIPPQFSELDRPVFEPGVEMNAAFAVVDSKWAVLCAAPFVNSNTRSDLCWRSDDGAFIANLKALHRIDHGEQPTAKSESELAKRLSSRDMVLTPANALDLYLLLGQRWTNVATSELSEGKAFDALVAGAPANLWLSPDGVYSRAALDTLKRRGWSINQAPKAFAGVMLTSPKMVFLGSQKLVDLHIDKSRALGLLIDHKYSAQVERLLQIR